MAKSKPEHEEEEVISLDKLDSRKIARYLYSKHKVQFWAYFNLVTSTLSMLAFGATVRYPSLLTVGYGVVGSEMGQLWVLLQSFNLHRIYSYHPEVFSTIFGRVAAIANLWSFLVLIQNVLQGLKMNAQVQQVFRANGISQNPPPKSGFDRWSSLLSLIPLLFVSRRGQTVQIQRNIRYADMDKIDPTLLHHWMRSSPTLRNVSALLLRGRISQWLSLDVMKLNDPQHPVQGPQPILLYIHGGAWMIMDKMYSNHSSLLRIASRGVIVCTINYRMSPEVTWPAHILDCKRALIFVKEHAMEWGGDPNNIFVSGESAGGHLSALMGCTVNFAPFQPPELADRDTSVAGCLPTYGVFDLTDSSSDIRHIRTSVADIKVGVRAHISRLVIKELYGPESKSKFDDASPMFHIRNALLSQSNPQVCPYFISHGTLDKLAAYDDSKEFFDILQEIRKKFGIKDAGDAFLRVEGGLHGYGYFPSVRSHALGDAMADFIFHHTTARRRAMY